MVATLPRFWRLCCHRLVRVRKGPGRRPLSAKRRRFMELRERGLGIDAAAAAKSAGHAPRGGTGRRATASTGDGRVIGFVPALDRLEVREISARFLSEDERVQIADLHRCGSERP